jgi:hypothetical protein
MSAAKEAMHLTTDTLERRAFHFRNLVVLFVAVAFGSAIIALVRWSPLWLLGWLTALPLFSCFLVVDHFVVARWQRKILDAWLAEELHLDNFVESMTSMRMLPRATLRSMLALLPGVPQEVAVQRLPLDVKRHLGELALFRSRLERDNGLAVAVASLLGVASVIWAAVDRSWWPLLGVPSAIALAFGCGTINVLRLRSYERRARDAD